MNGDVMIGKKANQKSALKQVLDTMKPYLRERRENKERCLMKYAILLSEAELECIVRLCRQAVTPEKRKRPKAKPLTSALI